MSNINSIFSTGLSGLMISQAGIDVTGHNIANVNTDGFSRQRVNLDTETPYFSGSAVFGRGVTLESITRVYDDTLAKNIMTENATLEYNTTIQTALEKIEVYFNELEDGSGLGESLREYFNSWQDLSNTAPDETDEAMVKRTALLDAADVLASKINQSFNDIESIREDSDYNISEYVKQINTIAENISYLNVQISRVEAVGDNANDFRDQRDQQLSKLSSLVNASYYERGNGMVAVYVGSNALVDEGTYFNLFAEANSENMGHYDITWGMAGDDEGSVDMTEQIRGGKIGAELYVRDEMLDEYISELDSLSAALIENTNRIHSTGVGLDRLTQITSSNGVTNPSYKFSETPGAFPYEVNDGTLRIAIYDEATGDFVENYDIDIDGDVDNLNSVIAKISAADGDAGGGNIQASISKNGTIKIYSDAGYTFSFAEDTSNFLVASGLNGFFAGDSADDIAVADYLVNNSSLISTGSSGAPGDNTAALEIAEVKFMDAFDDSDVTIDEFYTFFVSKIGSDKHKIDLTVDTKRNALDELELKMEEIKGVSMDEEMTALIQYQRAYQANARFITTVDGIMDKLINGTGLAGR